MKKILLSLVVTVGVTFFGNSKVLTVSNNPNSPGQYTELQAACDAASKNDTIYIQGSESGYNGASIYKPLVLIGAGALPDKRFPFPTKIFGTLNFGYESGLKNANGSKIFGCDITYNIEIAASNITIQRNRITTVKIVGASNVLIHNNIITNVIYFGGSNVFVKNNCLSSIGGNPGAGNNWVIANNIILGQISAIHYAAIYNNIIVTTGGDALSGTNYSSVSNNLFLGKKTFTEQDVIYGTNTGGNNIFNKDPEFVSMNSSIISYSYTNPATGPFEDYHLKPESPAKGTGVNGADMGIYGGDNPFFEGTPNDGRFRYFPMPSIPIVTDLNIKDAAIQKGGSINIMFKARKQD